MDGFDSIVLQAGRKTIWEQAVTGLDVLPKACMAKAQCDVDVSLAHGRAVSSRISISFGPQTERFTARREERGSFLEARRARSSPSQKVPPKTRIDLAEYHDGASGLPFEAPMGHVRAR
jgi:hypothetical protein